MGLRGARRIGLVAVGVLVVGLLWALPAAADLSLFAGSDAFVFATDGEGVNVRSAPGVDAEVLATLPEDTFLAIQDGPVSLDDGSNWYAVAADLEEGHVEGWVNADYLTGDIAVEEFVDDSDSAADGVPSIVYTNGDVINIRAEPTLDAPIVGVIPDGATVNVLSPGVADVQGIAWSQVRYDGQVGYSATALLGDAADTSLDLGSGATDEISNARTVEVADGAAPALTRRTDDVGAAIVAEALDYLGVPYVWGGSTPDGFDCSGFTYFVVSRVVDESFPRPNADQIDVGEVVGVGELQPGDLLFFQNTYQWGLSHVGIYLGDGRFVSASGEHDGVGVSNLNDPYWSSRYLAARRVR
jgi:cell wall-associated NlpC family hydrolase